MSEEDSERRKSERLVISLVAKVRKARSRGRFVPAETVDLSTVGVGLKSNLEAKRGDQLLLRLLDDKGAPFVQATCRVVWYRGDTQPPRQEVNVKTVRTRRTQVRLGLKWIKIRELTRFQKLICKKLLDQNSS